MGRRRSRRSRFSGGGGRRPLALPKPGCDQRGTSPDLHKGSSARPGTKPSKLAMRVRFPSPPLFISWLVRDIFRCSIDWRTRLGSRGVPPHGRLRHAPCSSRPSRPRACRRYGGNRENGGLAGPPLRMPWTRWTRGSSSCATSRPSTRRRRNPVTPVRRAAPGASGFRGRSPRGTRPSAYRIPISAFPAPGRPYRVGLAFP